MTWNSLPNFSPLAVNLRHVVEADRQTLSVSGPLPRFRGTLQAVDRRIRLALVPQEVAEVVEYRRCLQQVAGALAADLRRHQKGEAIEARADSALYVAKSRGRQRFAWYEASIDEKEDRES